MDQRSREKINIYTNNAARILFFQGHASMCLLVIRQMFEIYIYLRHIYCERDDPSDIVRCVSMACREIEQIVCASVWVIIFARLTITMAFQM